MIELKNNYEEVMIIARENKNKSPIQHENCHPVQNRELLIQNWNDIEETNLLPSYSCGFRRVSNTL